MEKENRVTQPIAKRCCSRFTNRRLLHTAIASPAGDVGHRDWVGCIDRERALQMIGRSDGRRPATARGDLYPRTVLILCLQGARHHARCGWSEVVNAHVSFVPWF